ncbi:Methylcrotonoyl-CoA carboxylase [Aphelenchoides fujianensis]|nr:Methylcrotonoyl-CoA carboxylase [Aphelenchoides fujianensis]
MPKLNSVIDPTGEAFARNAAHNRALVQALRAKRARAPRLARQAAAAPAGGAPAGSRLAVPGNRPAGRLRPLQRRGARRGDHLRHRPVIVANDATVKGGTYYPMTVKKHLRAQEIAAQNRLPCVYLVDSGGANLPQQDEVFPDREHFGRIFYNQAQMSRRGHRPDRLRHGLMHRRRRLRAGDERRDGHRPRPGHHLPGRSAAGEGRHGRGHLGRGAGRRRTHGRRSGVVDHVAENDEHALEIVRSIVANLNTTKPDQLVLADAEPPAYDPEELYGIVPTDVIARIVDGSRFDEFKALYGTHPGLRLRPHLGPAGGDPRQQRRASSPRAPLKGAHFIELACKRKIPLIFLQNISGFMVGGKYEAGGIAKDGAKLVTAVASAEVPKFTVLIGGSFGAGNYGMCGRAYSPRFLFTWPNSRISVMGGEQAASVLATVHRDAAKWTPEEAEAFKAPIRQRYEDEGNPYHATARLWDDGIIDPAQTRDVLGLAISASLNAPIPETTFGVFRM